MPAPYYAEPGYRAPSFLDSIRADVTADRRCCRNGCERLDKDGAGFCERHLEELRE